jgi:hypothetical protein
MGKEIDHDFSKGVSKVPATASDTNKVINMGAIQQNTSKELVNTTEDISQFADATIRILRTKL